MHVNFFMQLSEKRQTPFVWVEILNLTFTNFRIALVFSCPRS
jgi:hypothetical protein